MRGMLRSWGRPKHLSPVVPVAGILTAVTLLAACGYPSNGPATVPMHSSAAPIKQASAPLPAVAALPPNAHGDPPCPAFAAWGADPRGAGILVTYWSERPDVVTVLVRTTTGLDRADAASLGTEDLRLFEFPEVDHREVVEVLIITAVKRCFATRDEGA